MFPQVPPLDDEAGKTGYVFPTWRAALGDAHARIADAYETRARMFKAAHDAGLSYREIGEATGLSAAAVGKIIGKQGRATLDSPANG
jgi:DNA-directed RNA polymerase specialized sigma24 family protein